MRRLLHCLFGTCYVLVHGTNGSVKIRRVREVGRYKVVRVAIGMSWSPLNENGRIGGCMHADRWEPYIGDVHLQKPRIKLAALAGRRLP